MAKQAIDPGEIIEDLGYAINFFDTIDCAEESDIIKNAICCIVDLQGDIVALQQGLYCMIKENIKNAAKSS